MLNERPKGLETSSRRFACDRCRGQKLRCLREGLDPERCDRCARANACCTTSPAFQTKRPRPDASITPQDRSGQRQLQRSRGQRDDRNSPFSRRSTLEEGEHWGERGAGRIPVDKNDPSTLLTRRPSNAFTERTFLEEPWLASSQHDWQNQPDLAATERYVSFMEEDAVSNKSSNSNPALSWRDNENSAMCGLTFADAIDTSFMEFSSINELQEKNGRQEILAIPTPTSPTTASPSKDTVPPFVTADLTRTEDNGKESCVPDAVSIDISRSSIGRESGNLPSGQGLHIQADGQKTGGREGCMQRLSKLSLDLSSQLSRIDAGPPNVTLDLLISPSDGDRSPKVTPTDDILNGTREFLDILTLLSTSPGRAATTLSAEPCSTDSSHCVHAQHRKGRRSRTSSSVSSRSSSVYTSLDSLPTSPASITSANKKRSGFGDDPQLDSAAILLLTTCYLYILRLYVVLFAHVHVFLTDIASSDDPHICPIPEVSFSAFPLRESILQYYS